MKNLVLGHVALGALLAISAAGCTAQTGEAGSPPLPEMNNEAAVKPQGVLGAPSITAGASWGQFRFSGKNFYGSANVWVHAYTWNGTSWDDHGGTTVQASPMSCSKNGQTCFPGGNVSGGFTIPGSTCFQSYTVWARDESSNEWTSTNVNVQCN